MNRPGAVIFATAVIDKNKNIELMRCLAQRVRDESLTWDDQETAEACLKC